MSVAASLRPGHDRSSSRAARSAALHDPITFAERYRDLAPSVLRSALAIVGDRATAEDVTQDVFLRLWRQPAAYDQSRGHLRTYMTMMARSRAIDVVRARRTSTAAHAEAARRAAVGGPMPADLRSTYLAALELLPRVQQESVLLSDLVGLSDRRIADLRDVPLGTVKSRIRKGRSRLRANLSIG